jgi:hypothetical protein
VYLEASSEMLDSMEATVLSIEQESNE